MIIEHVVSKDVLDWSDTQPSTSGKEMKTKRNKLALEWKSLVNGRRNQKIVGGQGLGSTWERFYGVMIGDKEKHLSIQSLREYIHPYSV